MLLEKIKELIWLYKNRELVKNALDFYARKDDYERAYEYYKKGAFNMNTILREEHSPYQYHERLDFLKKFKKSREEALATLTQFNKNVILTGMTNAASAAITHKEKSDLMSIVMAIKISNPIYDITEISEEKSAIKLTIDSSLMPSDMIDILDAIYRSVSNYRFEYEAVKSYSLNRVVYQIEIGPAYSNLSDLLTKINRKIAKKVPAMLKNASPEASATFQEYIKEFYETLNVFDDIKNMVSVVKNNIVEIVESNRGLCAILLSDKEEVKE